MKKYSVFSLYVVKKENQEFICKKIYDDEYREVLTNEKLVLEENDSVKCLTRYYSILEVATYNDGKITNPLMLSKKDILLKYIEINQNVKGKRIDMDDILKRQQEELEGLKVLAKECPKLAKEYSLEKLQGTGILDKNGELIGPYKEIFTKRTDMDIMIDVWQDYDENVKNDNSDIPIINAKELHKQKTLDRKKNN